MPALIMACGAIVFGAASALAAPVTWHVRADLFGGGTLTGSFTYDADTNTYSSVNMVASGGGRATVNYVRPHPVASWMDDTRLLARPADPAIDFMTLEFAVPLSNAGGTVDLPVINESVCMASDCMGVNLYRLTHDAGQATTTAPPVPAAIPTLSEWAMVLLGVALAGGAALMMQRRRTT